MVNNYTYIIYQRGIDDSFALYLKDYKSIEGSYFRLKCVGNSNTIIDYIQRDFYLSSHEIENYHILYPYDYENAHG